LYHKQKIMPFFSVVIPLYNKEPYIKDSLQSVLQQEFEDFEIIIINDGSTDKSPEIIRGFKDDRIKIFSQKNLGVSQARNKGIEVSKGKIIAFLDADDIWHATHLKKIFQLYQRFPRAKLFATAYEIEYNKDFKKSFILHGDETEKLLYPFYKFIKGSPLFYTSNFAVLKEVFETEKAFKNHIHGEDTELFLRLGYKYPLAYYAKPTMLHLHNTSNSLFRTNKTEKKSLILKELSEMEKKDPYLKKFLDQNRFAWIMEYKRKNEKQKAAKLKNEINRRNLNFWQNILLLLPGKVLQNLKIIQEKLKNNRIYISPFE